MLKALVIACVVLLLALGAAVLVARDRGQQVETLTAEKALIQRHLDEANADIKVSAKNHNRMMADKDELLKAERERAAAAEQRIANLTSIRKDIDNAPESSATSASAAIDALLNGLRNLQDGIGQGEQPDDRLSGSGPARGTTGQPTAAAGAATAGHR
jgi:uncharacterized protein HemX